MLSTAQDGCLRTSGTSKVSLQVSCALKGQSKKIAELVLQLAQNQVWITSNPTGALRTSVPVVSVSLIYWTFDTPPWTVPWICLSLWRSLKNRRPCLPFWFISLANGMSWRARYVPARTYSVWGYEHWALYCTSTTGQRHSHSDTQGEQKSTIKGRQRVARAPVAMSGCNLIRVVWSKHTLRVVDSLVKIT